MEHNFVYIILFIAAFFSGLAVVLIKPNLGLYLKLLLSFSGAYLLALCVLHLIPELYEVKSTKVGYFILIGFVFQLFLELFSKGIEHGHFHSHHTDKKYVFPFSIFISLWLHSFIEGMALLDPNHQHEHHNNSLLLGIVIHKIPIAIVLATLLITNLKSKVSSVFFIVLFALSAPLGLFLSQHYGTIFLEDITVLMALAVGVLMHISTTILFESSENHKFNFKRFAVIIFGFMLAIFTL